MPAGRRRATFLSLVATAAALLAGCGKSTVRPAAGGGPARPLAPIAAQGAVSLSTRNTTRLGGTDPVDDAAAIARAVYPGLTPATRPHAVVLVDKRAWSAALAASALASAPLGAPLLYSEGDTLPSVSASSLSAMAPAGAASLGGAQVLSVATAAQPPGGLVVRSVPAGEPAVVAAGIERLLVAADGGRQPREVIVLAADAPRELQMPAAGLAAESGAPILFMTSARVPPPTATVLTSLNHPSIFVIGASAIGANALTTLAHYGAVTRIEAAAGEAADPVANAIAVARFSNGTFGWGVKEPGHGLVFANQSRALDAPAAAPLSASGDYGPLLLLSAPAPVPPALAAYLSDIQPAYTAAPQFRPVRGVYNHGWLVGDEQAISSVTQAELDSLLEISPRRQSGEEASVTQAE